VTRRFVAVLLFTLLALANAAWLHDFGGDHDHDHHDDAPTIVCSAHTGGTVVACDVGAVGPPVLVSYRLPTLISVPVVYPRRTLPPVRAPSSAAAAPRAPPFA